MQGKLYDGVTADPHAVTCEFGDAQLRLSNGSGWTDTVAAAVLTRVGEHAGPPRLRRSDREGWRLILPSEAAAEVTRLLGRTARYGRWVDKIGLLPAAAIGAAVTAAVVAFGYVAPQWIAPHVPQAWERNLGTAIVGDFGDNRCRNPEGQRALEALVERLEPGATRGAHRIKVAALDISLFNAAALPGGHIVVFKSAITETESSEELAGLMAHEIAHVRRRHVTEALIRELGVGALIRLFAGGLGANAEQLVALSYTREHEAEADGDAIAMLNRAGISPGPTADLFERLAQEQGEGGSYSTDFLESHPLSADRAKRFAAAVRKGYTYRPALTREQSDALYNVCLSPADAE